jgi:hypothetical protein
MTLPYTLTKELDAFDITHTSGNLKWVQFITDHIQAILNVSIKKEINVNDLNKYRHRYRDLFAKYDIFPEDAWIIMLINNLKLSKAIPQYTNMFYIPTQEYIQNLKENFSAYDSEFQ